MHAPFARDTVNGRVPQFFAIELADPTHTAFNNDHLPTTPPNLAFFATHTFRLVFNGGPGATVSGVLTAIPLPAAVILFARGLWRWSVLEPGVGGRGKTVSRRQTG
jgi:hypothetical protein